LKNNLDEKETMIKRIIK